MAFDETWLIDTAKVGGVLAMLYALGRGIRWLFIFSVGRLDMRQARLDKSLDERLTALELEVANYRMATAFLTQALHKVDPSNPALIQVAKLLGAGVPFTTGDFDNSMDDLLGKLP